MKNSLIAKHHKILYFLGIARSLGAQSANIIQDRKYASLNEFVKTMQRAGEVVQHNPSLSGNSSNFSLTKYHAELKI